MRLSATDPTAKAIASIAFPSYNGRKFTLNVVKETAPEISLTWDSENGGSYEKYSVVDLVSMQCMAGDISTTRQYATASLKLQDGMALVTHSYFCGKDMGITISVLEINATKMLPLVLELSENEKKCLVATRSLKSSYGGVSNYRQKESGLSVSEWSSTQELLKTKGLLAKNGAITPDGRNAVEGIR